MKFDRKKLALIFRQRQAGKEKESRADVRMMPRSKDNKNAIDAIRKIINKYSKSNSDIRKSLANRAGEYFRKSIEDHGFVEESVDLEEYDTNQYRFTSSADLETDIIVIPVRNPKTGKLESKKSRNTHSSKRISHQKNPNIEVDATSD